MLSKLKGSHLGMIVPVAVVVILAGSVVAASAASASRVAPRHHNVAQGIVTSVNGVSTPVGTTCGVASTAGIFTLVGMRKTIVTVDVLSPGTTFTDAALTSATFANVCVGGQVKVLGTLSSGTLTATAVTIVPAQAQGIVTSVNGVSTPVGTTCGVASTAGIFTLVGMRKTIVTVDVLSPGTTFTDAALTSATFANVCVGGQVKVLGTLSSGTLTATAVTIVPAQAQGIVTSVNGVSTPVGTTCGVASTAGIFTLVGMRKTIVTVDVLSPGTTFTDAALTSATFANVCVGGQVKVLGTLSSGTLTATAVTIVPAQAQGIVTSVNGVSTPVGTTCGVASTAGIFTLVGMRKTIVTVDVLSPGTTFTDAALTSATFANVCVGGQVKVLGTLSSGTLTATAVTIVPRSRHHSPA